MRMSVGVTQGFLLAGALVSGAPAALGQVQPAPGVPTTVQLPTFSVFTVQTTVSVPDRGAAFLGGINRAAEGSTVRGGGLSRSRSLGSARAASGMSVSATIIDNAELDREVLAQAAAARSPAEPNAVKAAGISRTLTRGNSPVESVAAIRERQAAAAGQRAGEAAEWLAKAQQAEAEGKTAVAKVFYQLVSKHAAPALKQQADARLAALTSKAGGVAR